MFTYRDVEVDTARQMQSGEEHRVHFIDVRSNMEISSGIIPGASHVPLHLLPMSIDKIPDDREVIIYCRTGARSAQACAYLGSLGKHNVHNLRGGILAWVKSGAAVA